MWKKGQERLVREFDMQQAAVREGMVDVYVALKQLKRTGGGTRRSDVPGLVGEALEKAVRGIAAIFPNNVIREVRA
jgi:hypothetical protein